MPKDNDGCLLSSEDSRRQSILDAAIVEFCKGYRKASTDAIVKSAGVSKGLLFHYFGTKKNLFLQAYDCALQAVIAEFYDLIDFSETDLLERWRQIALLKMDLMKQHPMIFDFIAHASFPDGEEVQGDIKEKRDSFLNNETPRLFGNIDRSLFRDDIDVDAAISTILYTMEGYAEDQASPEKSTGDYFNEYDRFLRDLDRYIELFRTCFYR